MQRKLVKRTQSKDPFGLTCKNRLKSDSKRTQCNKNKNMKLKFNLLQVENKVLRENINWIDLIAENRFKKVENQNILNQIKGMNKMKKENKLLKEQLLHQHSKS